MNTRSKSRKQADAKRFGVQTVPIQNNIQNQVAPVKAMTMEQVISEQYFMLSDPKDMDIEGLRYEDIMNNQQRRNYLNSLIANLPSYGTMSQQQKSWHFRRVSESYATNLQNTATKQKNAKKQVNFNQNQQFVVFDKHCSPERISQLQQSYDNTKF